MPDTQAESRLLHHAMNSHGHSTMMTMSGSDYKAVSDDGGHSSSMPCCDGASQCVHGHCSMTLALLSALPLPPTPIVTTPFQSLDVARLSPSYDILLPPPAR